MALKQSLRFRDRLSFRLMLMCMVCAFTLGVVLSLAQIAFDARRQSQEIDRHIEQLLTMTRQPATEAAYNFDGRLAQRVVNGLSKYDAVLRAELLSAPNETLARFERDKQHSGARALSDAIFGAERNYAIELRVAQFEDQIGALQLSIDTLPAGHAFLERAGFMVLAGLLRAVVLALALLAIFLLILTRPLTLLAEMLSQVNPQAPQLTRLPMLKGHERDELGLWIGSANALLQSIQDHLAHRRIAEEQASYLAHFDQLTDLPNRTLFYDRLGQQVQQARRHDLKVAVLYCDLRDFQYLNDRHGYSVGDYVLRVMADRIKAATGELGGLSRIGGDQFGIIIGDLQRIEAAADLAHQICEACREPIELDVETIDVDLAIGVSIFPDDADSPEALTQNAEKAMNLAKQGGAAGQVQFYVAELGERLRHRHQLQSELRRAVEHGNLSLHYQPQIATDRGDLVGAEALLRWDLAGQAVSPGRFIPLAEECGLINAIGHWTLSQACQQLRRWSEAGLRDFKLSLNVSAVQFQDRTLGRVVADELARHALSPQRLDLEITETAVMADLDHTARVLAQLREIGVGVSIDDFGTGQSSLSYLRRLPVTALKIDQSFIHEIAADSDSGLIVRAIIALAHNLRLEVVAEGVETLEQLHYLRDNNCDSMQGFLLSRPLPQDAFQALLARPCPLSEELQTHFRAELV